MARARPPPGAVTAREWAPGQRGDEEVVQRQVLVWILLPCLAFFL